jgi:hypothetical protein
MVSHMPNTTTTTTMTNTTTPLDYFTAELEYLISEGLAARAKIAEAILRPGYRVGSMWGLPFVEISLGDRATDLLKGITRKGGELGPVEFATLAHGRLADSLISGHFDPSSSNPFSNGLDSVERESARLLHRRLGSFLKMEANEESSKA